ncbi:MAG: 4-hydroxy-tetrahydrodipicolinate synthase [Cytophagales bacterium]|nr:MAG: 4-hydroxy-tetrahydrodipicolinate synthase [Cytophagales bacterium]
MYNQFVGTGVALVTPFDNSGAIDINGLINLLNHVINNKVEYLVVNGTTAESATTTEEEKKLILQTVLEFNQRRLPIMYGLGGNNTAEIIDKIKSTNFDGVDAILSVSPYYNKPSQEGIYLHYKAIAEASPIPIFLYNVPGRTSSNILPSTTIRLSKISNIIGIKDANTDVSHNIEILKGVSKDFLVVSGDDMWALPLISLGGKGAISVLADAYPLEYSNMIRHGLNNQFNEATEILKSFSILNPLLYEEGNPVGIKTVLKEMKLCESKVRLPLANASATLVSKILEAIKSVKKA